MHTFVDPLARAERVARDKIALQSGEFRVTYGELGARCRRLAGALHAAGIAPGERVAVLAANSPQYIELYAGVPAAGRVVVPLNTRHADPEL
ncbi:MAG: AMP-binding protein, partial [Gammaproteobacteria bacterium]|nr:AMP-binding protein [Gammaproteobacteria bacterium]